MKKNMFKRAWLNIKRKPSKSIILFIIMFVIANLVLSSLAISNAVDESTKYAKETLGSEVYLNADMEKMRESMSDNIGSMQGNMGNMQGMDNLLSMRPEITISMVTDIASSNYVKDYTYSTMVQASPGNYAEYETSSGEMFNRNRSGITAINSYAFISEVNSNTYEITEGTYFDETTNNSVIISYELATLNNFVVGDEISFIHTETNEEIFYTIVGIFTSTVEGNENNIYMNLSSSENLMSSSQYNNGDYVVNNVVYYLTNPDDVDSFIEDASAKYNFEELNLLLDIDTSAYDQMAGPIESVGGFSDTILIVVIIAAVLIVTLIINNSIKDRKYEMGVLMSLGAPKLNIIGQILIELVVVATAGFVLSLATSSFIAASLSESLLENQLTMSEEASESNFGRPTMGGMRNPGSLNGNNTDVEVIDEINVNVSIEEYILLFVTGYLIVIAAMIIPVINITKYEPKTILTGRE